MGRDRHLFCLYSSKAEVGQAPDRMFSKSAIVVKLVNCEGLDKQLSCMAYVIPKEEPGLMLTNLFPSLVFFFVLFRFFFFSPQSSFRGKSPKQISRTSPLSEPVKKSDAKPKSKPIKKLQLVDQPRQH